MAFEVVGNKSQIASFVLPPNSTRNVIVRFSPVSGGTSVSTLVVRSNLTLIELVRLSGETGKYTFGFPKVNQIQLGIT